VVPFGEVARVADPPNWEPYDEEWLPGCFDHQLNAANRIHANYEHLEGPANIVGHGLTLRSEPDGYHVTSTIHRTPQGDATLEMLKGGALPSVSLEARAVKNIRSATGVMQRAKAHLRGFAFCREGAFAGAQVLAVRNQDDDEDEVTVNAPPSYDMDPELVARLRAHGAWVPDRYQAHPDMTGTPDSSGTPDDGTRQSEAKDELEERQ
jgi:HK97 family phage prohead protease